MSRNFIFVMFGLMGLWGCAAAPSATLMSAPPIGVSVSPGEAAVESEFQRRLVLEQKFLSAHRLDSIRFHLGRGATAFCDKPTHGAYGFRVANSYSFAAARRSIMRRGFGFDGRVRVLHVIAGSPAQKAGLHSGDVIAAVNGRAIPSGSGGPGAYESAAGKGGLMVLQLEREGKGTRQPRRFAAELRPVEICAFDVELRKSTNVGARATARGVEINEGMMWFAKNDELAYVIAHEFAHVLGNHLSMVNRSGVSHRDVEAAADYLGLYVMARGGYDISTAPKFWRRIAANFPRMIASAATHPATAYRYVAMTKAVAEIRAKMAAGAPLLPAGSSASIRAIARADPAR